VLVTFDDGDRSIIDHALPILRAHRVPAVAFVIAGLVGTAQPPWWTEVMLRLTRGGTTGTGADGPIADVIRAMKQMPDADRREALDTIRGQTHEFTAHEPQLEPDDLRALEAAGVAIGNHTLTHPCLNRCGTQALVGELDAAHRVLSGILGRAPSLFAYPNGDFDPRAERWLREHHYELAFLFDHRVAPIPVQNRLRISRIRVDASASVERFRILLSGLHSALLHAFARV
jgi:peptidoglycan/xylan/chitin deacetylase (PgdA/CDA1 family)